MHHAEESHGQICRYGSCGAGALAGPTPSGRQSQKQQEFIHLQWSWWEKKSMWTRAGHYRSGAGDRLRTYLGSKLRVELNSWIAKGAKDKQRVNEEWHLGCIINWVREDRRRNGFGRRQYSKLWNIMQLLKWVRTWKISKMYAGMKEEFQDNMHSTIVRVVYVYQVLAAC